MFLWSTNELFHSRSQKVNWHTESSKEVKDQQEKNANYSVFSSVQKCFSPINCFSRKYVRRKKSVITQRFSILCHISKFAAISQSLPEIFDFPWYYLFQVRLLSYDHLSTEAPAPGTPGHSTQPTAGHSPLQQVTMRRSNRTKYLPS